MTSQHHTQNNPAVLIEKHILQNACTSNWLRSAYEQAIRRDPVDALDDAELLASALRARTLETLSEGATFDPQFISTLLKQHADALALLSRACLSPKRTAEDFHMKRDIDFLVLHLHQIARKVAPRALDSSPSPFGKTPPAIASSMGDWSCPLANQ